MEENAFDKIKSMINNGNIPEDLQKIISNMNSSSKGNGSSNNNSASISPETISNLMSMLNSKNNNSNGTAGTSTSADSEKSKESEYTNSDERSNQNENNFNNMGIDFETIMKFKTIMDKMNAKDDPRSKLLTSLKPYLKDSRKSKVDQYIQFLNMSKVIDVFSRQNGDGKS